MADSPVGAGWTHFTEAHSGRRRAAPRWATGARPRAKMPSPRPKSPCQRALASGMTPAAKRMRGVAKMRH
eukprot:15462173-Alexandrium_andersonii.AAC.1